MGMKEKVINAIFGLFSVLPLKRKIVFESYFGESCGGSPGAIFEYLRDNGYEYEYVWLLKDAGKSVIGAKVVDVLSWKSIYHYATAKVWIDDSRKVDWLRKRKGQYYIQTWHGSIALKKIEKDAESKLSDRYIRSARHDSEMADLFLSASRWSSENYRSAFWYEGNIMECGLPRSDIFFRDREGFYRKVCAYYGVNTDTKFVIYAPTFRVNKKLDSYDLDYDLLHKTLTEVMGGDWRIVIRLHPIIQNQSDQLSYDGFLLDGSAYPDINELIMACELLITDYSSCMFDALLAQTKVQLYASDVDDYEEDRGMYFSFEELPFPLAESNAELMHNILDFNESEYHERARSFMERCGFYDKGHATESVVSYIVEKMNEV